MSAENSGSFGRFCVYVSCVDKKPTVKKKKKKKDLKISYCLPLML